MQGRLQRWFGTAHFTPRAVVALFVPIAIEQGFITAFSAVTPLIVAPVGIEAVSAVSTIEAMNFFVHSVFVSLALAGSVLVAQHKGRADADGVRRAAGGAAWAAVLPATGLGIALLAAQRPVAHLLLGAAGPLTQSYGQTYLTAAAISYPAFAIVESCAQSLRGIARTRASLALTTATNGGFLVLAAIAVRGLNLGITGLAISLVVARYLTAGLALVLVRLEPQLRFNPRPDLTTIKRVLIIGIPFVVEQVYFNGGKLVIQVFIVGMGTLATATHAIVSSLLIFNEIIPQAMALALIPLVGQSIGGGRPDDARRLMRSILIASVAISVTSQAVMLAFVKDLLPLYHTPPAAVHTVVTIFVMALVGRALGCWSLSFIAPSGLRAAGDAVYTTTVATIGMSVRVSLAWLVGVHLGYGVTGVWAVMISEWALRAVAFGLRLRGSAWEHRSFVAGPGTATPAATPHPGPA